MEKVKINKRRLITGKRTFWVAGITISVFIMSQTLAGPPLVPEGFILTPLGQSAELEGDGSIKISDFATDQSFILNTLEDPTRGVAAWFKVKVCAGDLPLEGFTSESNFALSRKIKTGFEQRLAAPHPSAKEPQFATPYVPVNIEAGSCREGWVSVVSTEDTSVLEGANAILFDPATVGFVPSEQQKKVAWLIE
jgi:hypothetical protein